MFLYEKRNILLNKGNPGRKLAIKHLLLLWGYEFEADTMNGPLNDHNGHARLNERLQESCILGNIEATAALITSGADVDAPDFEGRTPLMLALTYRNFGCALAVLEAGCDVYRKDRVYRYQALKYALRGEATLEAVSVIEHMLPGAAQQYDGLLGFTPLHEFTLMRGDEALLQNILTLLLDSGQKIDSVSNNGATAIIMAVIYNNPVVLKLLRAAGACWTSIDEASCGILHQAAFYGGSELLQYLIDSDISTDVDLKSIVNVTALDIFRYCMYADNLTLTSGAKKPSHKETKLFETLMRTARDRYLNSEIGTLSSIIKLLTSSNLSNGEMDQFFDALMTEKKKYGKQQELETLRVIRDIQIPGGMVDAAVEALQEIIEVHRETMSESPFARSSGYDWMKPPGGESESVTAEENSD